MSDNIHEELVEPTRELLQKAGKPYVIENVVGAPLIDPITLCGSSFNLRVRRHRLFESSLPIKDVPCQHEWQDSDKIYTLRKSKKRGLAYKSGVLPVYGNNQVLDLFPGETHLDINSSAMGIYWMTWNELTQAIPPAYTKYIGEQILDQM